MANVQTNATATATRKPATAKGGKAKGNANNIMQNAYAYAAQAQVGLAAVTGLPTIPAQAQAQAQAAPVSLAAQLAAAQQASAAAPTQAQATARQPRQPAHAGGVFGHTCTVGRRAGKCWYAAGSAGYNIGALLCQHAAQGRKAAVAAAVAAGHSAGSATSCWGDMVAFNASLANAGLGNLAHAYAAVQYAGIKEREANSITANA